LRRTPLSGSQLSRCEAHARTTTAYKGGSSAFHVKKPSVKRILFLCSRNKLRSPTAEHIFAGRPDLEVASAGLNADAETPCSAELIEWADLIFVMEKAHRTRLSQRFKRHLRNARIICLDIPDNYAFMQPELVHLLQTKVARHLPAQ
jgi:predicted protein tyrosine phosphatase